MRALPGISVEPSSISAFFDRAKVGTRAIVVAKAHADKRFLHVYLHVRQFSSFFFNFSNIP